MSERYNFSDKRGQAQIMLVFMLGVLFFVIGLGLASPLNNIIKEVRGQSFEGYYYNVDKSVWEVNDSVVVNCTDASLSNQNKAVCTSLDVIPPFFIGIIFGLAGMAIGGIAIR